VAREALALVPRAAVAAPAAEVVLVEVAAEEVPVEGGAAPAAEAGGRAELSGQDCCRQPPNGRGDHRAGRTLSTLPLASSLSR
jgi:hypothetical protein